MKGCSAFSKALASLEHHHQIVSCHIWDTRWEVLLLCRGAVGVFYCPSRLGNIYIYIYMYMCVCVCEYVYILMHEYIYVYIYECKNIYKCLFIQDTRWGGGLTSLQRCRRCILQPQPTGEGEKLFGVSGKCCGHCQRLVSEEIIKGQGRVVWVAYL